MECKKYLRRREKEKMMWCLVELDLFSLLGSKSKSIRTNLKNRIIVMCFEELCFAEWDKLLIIKRKIDEWENGGREDRKLLVDIMNILINSELLRLNSDVNSYFGVGVRKYGYEEVKDIEANLDLVDKYRKKDDDMSVLEDMSKFIKLFNEDDDMMFYWVYEILYKDDVKGGLRYRRKGCEYIIWDFLYDKCGDNELLKECLDFGLREYFKKDRKERKIFLLNSIFLVKNMDNFDWDGKKLENKELEVSNEYVDILYNIEERERLFFDDYVIDMHTREGRRKGKDKLEFMKEGSKIINENKEWYVDKYRKGYNKMKVEQFKNDEKKKVENRDEMRKNKVREWQKKKGKLDFNLERKLKFMDLDRFSNIELCCENVCGNKVMCFFCDYKGRRLVMKEGRKSLNYNRDYEVVDSMKKMFGLRKIGMFRIRSNKIIKRIDKGKKSWVNNYRLEKQNDVVYNLMNVIEGKECVKNKNRINIEKLIKIGLFRGIFRCSDFNLRNVLINRNNELISIDENEIGKRLSILDKNFCFKKEN